MPAEATPELEFLGPHLRVLRVLAQQPEITQHALTDQVDLSPPSVRKCINELEQAGYLRSEKAGRRRTYEVVANKKIEGRKVQELLDFLDGSA